MPLTRYGIIIWGPATAIAAALAAVLALLGWWWGIAVVAVVWLAVAAFFRDPIRRLPTGLDAGAMLSPADGKVSAVLSVDHHDATEGPAAIVRIFLSVLDVHVNRSPCAAEVVDLRYAPGRFLDARLEESARVNESNLIRLRLRSGDMLGVRQVSGKVARRIVCHLRPGERLERGQRFGMIRFGSTTELILPRPSDVDIRVKAGDRVKGGVTVLAVLPSVVAGGERRPADP